MVQLNTATRSLEKSDDLATSSTFKVLAGAKMFEILSDKLYEKKFHAIVREYSCNCLDAHAMNGATVPFEVYLPNDQAPQIVFKDFGPGLSPSDIGELFTTYFGSNKTNSNSQIGGLGLGSKSAFAYADMFTVTSRFDGFERSWACFRNEYGEPQLSPMLSEVESDETGLEVQIPVHKKDFYSFQRAVAETLQWFDPKTFTVDGYYQPVIVPSLVAAGEGWVLRSTTNGRASVAIMGPVAYEIDFEQVFDGESEWDLRRLSLRHSLELTFNIGELEFQPNRERLGYTADTKRKLRERHDAVVAEIVERIHQLKAGVASRYEMYQLVVALRPLRRHERLSKLFPKELFDYGGKTLHNPSIEFDRVWITPPADSRDMQQWQHDCDTQRTEDPDAELPEVPLWEKTFPSPQWYDDSRKRRGVGYTNRASVSSSRTVEVTEDGIWKTVLIYNDLDGKSRTQNKLGRLDAIRSITQRKHGFVPLIGMFSAFDWPDIESLANMLGGLPSSMFVKMSEITFTPRYKERKYQSYKAYEWTGAYWSERSIDPEAWEGEQGIFVTFDKDTPVNGLSARMAGLLPRKLERSAERIWGFNKGTMKAMDLTDWWDLEEVFADYAQRLTQQDPALLQYMKQHDLIGNLHSDHREVIDLARATKPDTTKDSVWNALVTKIRTVTEILDRKPSNHSVDVMQLALRQGFVKLDDVPVIDLTKEIAAVLKKRPFFAALLERLSAVNAANQELLFLALDVRAKLKKQKA